MTKRITKFFFDDDGAVTVDWVVLTAFIIGMTLVIIAGIMAAATDPAESLGAWLTTETVGD